MKHYHTGITLSLIAIVFSAVFSTAVTYAQTPRSTPDPRAMGIRRAAPTPRPALRPAPKEEVVDLNSLSASAASPSPSPGARPTAKKPPLIGFPSLSRPSPDAAESPIRFKVYFDLNLYSRPGVSDLTLDNFHSFLFLEGTPMPDMQFSFDVATSPRFYELDWNLTPTFQLRMGKIWIPYDDTQFHNIYGGRVNVSKLQLGSAFLPDTWTDLGVGIKWTAADVRDLNVVADLYVVNGFHAGGTDPVTPTNPYPSFSDLSTAADNNTDKAIGGRVHGLFWNRLGLGTSFYTGRWSDQAQPNHRMLIYSGDLQYKFPPTMSELRIGLMSMKVDVTDATVYRAGTYLEFGQYLTRTRTWKLLFRGGTLQMDDRTLDINDQRIVGAMLIWRPNVIQFSLEHSRDLQKVVGKTNYWFTNLRMAIMF